MDEIERSRLLTAAECAAGTGLTVRALRVYEEHGLISPGRSAGGWRLYGQEELVKLNTIAVLKGAGLSLAQIREVTRSGSSIPPLRQILEIQLGAWKSKRDEADRGLAIVQAALERLGVERTLSVDDLCRLLRSFEMNTTSSQSPERDLGDVTLDGAVLDRYAGFYAPHDGEFGLYTITRTDERLAMQAPGQPPMDLYPTSETDFTMKLPDLQVAFSADANGEVTELVMRTQGFEIVARRVDLADAEAIQAKLAERIRSNVPRPGSREALHRLAEGIRAGTPPYDEMSRTFGQFIERQLARLQPVASYLGPIRSIEFQGIGSQGWDVYDVHRERGTGRWRIALGSDGKILGAMATITSPLTLGP